MIFTNEIEVTNTPLSVDTTGQTINVGNFPATQAVTGPLTDAQLRATPVPVSGTVAVSNFPGASTATATVTNLSVGVTVSTLSASNAAKTKVIIWNETGTLYVKLGTLASSTSYSYRLTANMSLEVEGYHGVISGIKASGTTSVLVTEIGI